MWGDYPGTVLGLPIYRNRQKMPLHNNRVGNGWVTKKRERKGALCFNKTDEHNPGDPAVAVVELDPICFNTHGFPGRWTLVAGSRQLHRIASITTSILFSYRLSGYPLARRWVFSFLSVQFTLFRVGLGLCACSENIEVVARKLKVKSQLEICANFSFCLAIFFRFGSLARLGAQLLSTDRLICNLYVHFFTLITGIIIFRLLWATYRGKGCFNVIAFT
ncbi:hypothetical protein QBC45DRAFT_430726 [Copromyces sp. CBS 386.78]|nr:hypothetical protein QBC45DRAFT_430726 [Copromyces sp. CBS 386.78]